MGDTDGGPLGCSEYCTHEEAPFEGMSFVFGFTLGALFTALVVILIIAVET